ncbi:MAG: hypothetical protein A3G24_15490 [Betaproteobacteria bacterium RIFCSPLOWO2_12_FULL_62_13]|nr:MAG: hypothetical protein A3G24_15490 [Betaproteobacteria bacterium RIFCSPLOWO2_12_FULL_62_13]
MTQERTRIAEDEKGKRATYDDIRVGETLGEMAWVVTEEMIDQQCEMDMDYHLWFSVDSPWGGRIAPPQLSYRPPRWLFSRAYNVRGLFYKWEMENLKPIKPGVTLKVTGTIADKYVKNDREFVVYQAEAVDSEGSVIFRTRRTHVLDFVERTAPRAGKGIDSGIKPEKI